MFFLVVMFEKGVGALKEEEKVVVFELAIVSMRVLQEKRSTVVTVDDVPSIFLPGGIS